MIISILQDEKNHDICLTSEAVSVLVQNHHTVLIEGEPDNVAARAYMSVGAYIINTKEELLDRGNLLIKKMEPASSEIGYLNGEEKIFLTHIDPLHRESLRQILKHKISYLNYMHLPEFKKQTVQAGSKLEFSNYVLPFVLELAAKGLKALVDDEVLRTALVVMQGKVYSEAVAKSLKKQCYEY